MDANKIKSRLKLLSSAISLACISSSSYATMQVLDDQSLSQETGQAAFYTSYNAPSGSGTGATPSDYGFFTLGLNGTIQLNANIDHLQLGCGGVNGPGCDIDINNLALSGPNDTTDATSGSPTFTATQRAATDAVLTNPFLQLAIANPNSLSTRQIVGINFGAQNVLGLLTAGIANPASLNGSATSPKGVGINTLSGYMSIGAASGTAMTAAQTIVYSGATGTQINTGTPILGNANANLGLGNLTLTLSSTQYTLNLPSTAVNLTTAPTVVNGTRLSSVALTATGTTNPIYLNGSLTASAEGLLTITDAINPNTSSVNGLGVTSNISEALSYIHTINVNNPVSLSLQSAKVLWPGSPAADIAQPGWWMGFGNTVNIGNITPTSQVVIPTPTLQQVLILTGCAITSNAGSGGQTGCANYGTPLACGFLGASCIGGTLPTQVIQLAAGTTVSVPLNNLTLAAQTPPTNCYGGMKFC